MIPMDFEDQFPFLNYDAHGEDQFNRQYIEVGIERTEAFFAACRYQYVVFNFRHNMRNRKIVDVVGPRLLARGLIAGYAVLPTLEHYEQARREDFINAGFKMFPELWPCILDPMLAQVRTYAAQARADKGQDHDNQAADLPRGQRQHKRGADRSRP
jgi:hypothetical protein